MDYTNYTGAYFHSITPARHGDRGSDDDHHYNCDRRATVTHNAPSYCWNTDTACNLLTRGVDSYCEILAVPFVNKNGG